MLSDVDVSGATIFITCVIAVWLVVSVLVASVVTRIARKCLG